MKIEDIISFSKAFTELPKDSFGTPCYPFNLIESQCKYITRTYRNIFYKNGYTIHETTADYVSKFKWYSRHKVYALYLLPDRHSNVYEENIKIDEMIIQANEHGITTDNRGIIYHIDIEKFEDTLYLFTVSELGLL